MTGRKLAGTSASPRRGVEQPTVDEHGAERHPAWALLGASRVQNGPPGATLFASDIRHQHTVRIRLHAARRTRDLHRDHIMAANRGVLFEVEMSEAQWASFVSTMNVGDGVPCTVRTTPGFRDVPEVPFESRLQETRNEVKGKSDEAIAAVQAAFEAFEARPIKANRDTLKFAIKNLPANMAFAADSLTKHAEDVVQKARADVEAMVTTKAMQLGIEPGELGKPDPERILVNAVVDEAARLVNRVADGKATNTGALIRALITYREFLEGCRSGRTDLELEAGEDS